MAGFNLGSILGGVTNGIKRGIQLDAQFLSSFIWATEHAVLDTAPLNALIVIAKQNVAEAIDETGNVLPSVIPALLGGSVDPFAGSRHAFEAWQAKYGVH